MKGYEYGVVKDGVQKREVVGSFQGAPGDEENTRERMAREEGWMLRSRKTERALGEQHRQRERESVWHCATLPQQH